MKQLHFPQGIAIGEAFCNRDVERESIKRSIRSHEHLVLVAPRRYGKTSLITQVLKESTLPGKSVDFLFALTQAEVTRLVGQCVSAVVNQLLARKKSSVDKIIQKIKQFNPKLTLNFLGQQLEVRSQQSGESGISELLLALDEFATQAKQTCVVVFDEFQQVAELKTNHAIEAAIRHAVERSQSVTYIFCGSKRHLLREMFSSRARPLYRLCELMVIDRIRTDCYQKFIGEVGKQRWGETLDIEAINEIIELTENHPYYVNILCRQLWQSDCLPTQSIVKREWDDYVERQSAWIVTDIDNLTLNRRKLIWALAHEPTNEPQGQEFSARAGLSPSGTSKSLVDLQRLDLIYKDQEGYYRLMDPAIAYFLSKKMVLQGNL